MKEFDASSYQTVQVFYPSKDGTKIPMFIVHKKVSGISLILFFFWGGGEGGGV